MKNKRKKEMGWSICMIKGDVCGGVVTYQQLYIPIIQLCL